MSPVPSRDRLGEYAVKAAHLGLRQVAQTPEQRRARDLAAQAQSVAGGGTPRVLVLTPRDWSAHVHWEAMIAQALRVRGAEVVFGTCGGGLEICDRANTWEAPPMPCRSCTRYVQDSLDAHGFPQQVIRDGWVDDDPGDWPEIDELSAAELDDVEWEGLPLGQIVKVPVRWFLMSDNAEADPLGALTTRRFLRSARRVARGLKALIDDVRPDKALLLNGLFFFEAIAWELCRQRGIDVITYERGFIKETLVFRRDEPACLTDVSHVWQEWRDLPLSDAEGVELDRYLLDRRQGLRTIDRYWKDPVFVSPDRPEGGRLVTLFTNLTWDSAVIGQQIAFPSIRHWLEAAVQFFADRPEHRLIIRIHPAEVKLAGKQTREPLGEHVREAFGDLPPNVELIPADNPISSYPLMEAADVGLVFTSTTGLEMALAGKPVVVAGRTHYRDKGFTLDAGSEAEWNEMLEKALADPSSSAPDPEAVRRYAYLFFFRAPVPTPGVIEHVPGLARITVEALDDLRPGRDEALDRIVDGILGDGDFVSRRRA